MVAMAGMLLAGSKIFTSIGIGALARAAATSGQAMIVVFLAMVGSLTVLPALLAKLGDRIDRGLLAVIAAGARRAVRPFGWQPALFDRLVSRRTLPQRIKGERSESRLWGFILRPALRFPPLAGRA